jgi:hypothetical protein
VARTHRAAASTQIGQVRESHAYHRNHHVTDALTVNEQVTIFYQLLNKMPKYSAFRGAKPKATAMGTLFQQLSAAPEFRAEAMKVLQPTRWGNLTITREEVQNAWSHGGFPLWWELQKLQFKRLYGSLTMKFAPWLCEHELMNHHLYLPHMEQYTAGGILNALKNPHKHNIPSVHKYAFQYEQKRKLVNALHKKAMAGDDKASQALALYFPTHKLGVYPWDSQRDYRKYQKWNQRYGRPGNAWCEFMFNLWPCIILVFLQIPAVQLYGLMSNMVATPYFDLTLKVVGHQWFWHYEYPDLEMNDE